MKHVGCQLHTCHRCPLSIHGMGAARYQHASSTRFLQVTNSVFYQNRRKKKSIDKNLCFLTMCFVLQPSMRCCAAYKCTCQLENIACTFANHHTQMSSTHHKDGRRRRQENKREEKRREEKRRSWAKRHATSTNVSLLPGKDQDLVEDKDKAKDKDNENDLCRQVC